MKRLYTVKQSKDWHGLYTVLLEMAEFSIPPAGRSIQFDFPHQLVGLEKRSQKLCVKYTVRNWFKIWTITQHSENVNLKRKEEVKGEFFRDDQR